MRNSAALKQTVTDIFHTHNPIEADCLSVYEKVVTDLLRYWSYDDSKSELEAYIRGVLFMHTKQSVQVSSELVAAIYEARKLVR
jgi:hypothetical protein